MWVCVLTHVHVYFMAFNGCVNRNTFMRDTFPVSASQTRTIQLSVFSIVTNQGFKPGIARHIVPVSYHQVIYKFKQIGCHL